MSAKRRNDYYTNDTMITVATPTANPTKPTLTIDVAPPVLSVSNPAGRMTPSSVPYSKIKIGLDNNRPV
jgi:hypothetical protein